MKIITKYQFPIICILVFCFVVSLAGCYSMKPEIINAEDISHQKEYEIYSLILKDSSKIQKAEPPNYMNFVKGNTDSTGKFVYSVRHNVYDSNKTYIHTLVLTDTLPLIKVSKVEIGKSKLDMTATIIVSAVSVLLLLTLIGGALVSDALPY